MFSLKNSEKNDAIPTAFLDAFGRLARRMKTDRLDARTARDYWTALQDLPLDRVTAAADELAKQQVFFPAVAEWRRAALGRRQSAPPVDCQHCQGTGLIRICYQSGELFDVAICACRAGTFYRHVGEGVVRRDLGLLASQQVAYLEDVQAAHAANEAEAGKP
jgi:hypothetical protein